MPTLNHLPEDYQRHIDDIWSYCNSVLEGERPACRWERLAVERFADDLRRAESEGYPWWFSFDAAVKAISFCEKFPHIKGRWARLKGRANRIKLEPWQKFVIGNIFGWLSKENGLRRFAEVYARIPRKNAKSTMAALIGLYGLVADNEPGAEVYCGATTQKQAWEVFKPAKLMTQRQPRFRRKFDITVHAGKLTLPDESTFEPVIGKPGDGASPHIAIIDEYHEHPDDSMYSTMDTGMLAREQPLLLVITTAGDNLNGACHEHDKQCQKILEGHIDDERTFAIIYTIDDGMEWDTVEALRMANPNLGVSINEDFLLHKLGQAKKDPAKAGHYKTKHLNMWVGAKEAWMPMNWWNRQAADIKRGDFIDCRNASSLDLSSKEDITCRGDLFERVEDDEKTHYYFFPKFYIPEETANDSDHPNHRMYQQWIDQGYLVATDGDIIDYDEIEKDAISHCENYDTETIGYDPWGATETAQRLQSGGIDVLEIAQNTKQLSEPMKMVKAYIKAGRFHHDGNPVMDWMISNVIAKEDINENIYPNKKNRHSKIDGAVSGIMSLSLLMTPEDDDDDEDLDDYLEPITV